MKTLSPKSIGMPLALLPLHESLFEAHAIGLAELLLTRKILSVSHHTGNVSVELDNGTLLQFRIAAILVKPGDQPSES